MKKKLNTEKNNKDSRLKDRRRIEKTEKQREKLPDSLRKRPDLKKIERKLLGKPQELKKKLLKPPKLLLRQKEKSLLPLKPNRRLTMKSKDLRKREEPRLRLRRRQKKMLPKLRKMPDNKRLKTEKEEPQSKLLNKRQLPLKLIRE